MPKDGTERVRGHPLLARGVNRLTSRQSTPWIDSRVNDFDDFLIDIIILIWLSLLCVSEMMDARTHCNQASTATTLKIIRSLHNRMEVKIDWWASFSIKVKLLVRLGSNNHNRIDWLPEKERFFNTFSWISWINLHNAASNATQSSAASQPARYPTPITHKTNKTQAIHKWRR